MSRYYLLLIFCFFLIFLNRFAVGDTTYSSSLLLENLSNEDAPSSSRDSLPNRPSSGKYQKAAPRENLKNSIESKASDNIKLNPLDQNLEIPRKIRNASQETSREFNRNEVSKETRLSPERKSVDGNRESRSPASFGNNKEGGVGGVSGVGGVKGSTPYIVPPNAPMSPENGPSYSTPYSTYTQPTAPALSTQIKDLFSTQKTETSQEYLETLIGVGKPNRTIELEIGFGYLKNDSDSDFSFRKYRSASPMYNFKLELWLTPLIGAYGGFQQSLDAEIASTTLSKSNIIAQHEWVEVGVDFRKYFILTQLSKYFTYGIHIKDYKLTIPSDELTRVRIKSTGLGFHLQITSPLSFDHYFVLGGNFDPKVFHSEQSTGIDFQSGQNPESSRVGVFIGTDAVFSQKEQFFWRINLELEKNQFLGNSTIFDYGSTSYSRFTSVFNTFTSFTLGYQWGK